MKKIYLDIAASTPVSQKAKKAMEPYWSSVFANPYSKHSPGREAGEALDRTREELANMIGSPHKSEKEIILTSGGTEANTLALRGYLEAVKEKKGTLKGLNLIISSIEHPSVAEVIPYAKQEGMQVKIVTIGGDGIVDIKELRKLLDPKIILVTVGLVNSEIGTTEPVREISRILEKKKREGFFDEIYKGYTGPVLHSDATQAPLWLDINVESLGVDMLTLDAHKTYGPKGVGLLYAKKGTPLKSLMFGSTRSRYYRPGTPALPLIAGFAAAMKEAGEKREERVGATRKIQDHFFRSIEEKIPNVRINGSKEKRIAGNVSLTIPGAEHEFLQVALDQEGISCATRSACLEEGGEGSYVIAALSGKEDRNALRFSFDGLSLGKKEIDRTVEVLLKVLQRQKFL